MALGLWQRTVLRVIAAGAFLMFLFYRTYETGGFSKENSLYLGIGFFGAGLLTFFLRAKFDRAAPDLQDRLTPVWGYGVPRRYQPVTSYLILALGVGLIIWSQTA